MLFKISPITQNIAHMQNIANIKTAAAPIVINNLNQNK